jgi:biopolymer transport protein ExbD
VTPSPLPVEERPDDITVSIEADLNRFINTKWYPDREFNLTMPRLTTQNIRARVLVRADRRLPFGRVRSLIHDIAIAGGDPIILLTEHRHN